MIKKLKENKFGDTEKIITVILIGVSFLITLYMYFANVFNV